MKCKLIQWIKWHTKRNFPKCCKTVAARANNNPVVQRHAATMTGLIFACDGIEIFCWVFRVKQEKNRVLRWLKIRLFDLWQSAVSTNWMLCNREMIEWVFSSSFDRFHKQINIHPSSALPFWPSNESKVSAKWTNGHRPLALQFCYSKTLTSKDDKWFIVWRRIHQNANFDSIDGVEYKRDCHRIHPSLEWESSKHVDCTFHFSECGSFEPLILRDFH